jgi:hypothetical protein
MWPDPAQPSPVQPGPALAPLPTHMRPLLLSLSHLDFPRSNLPLLLPPLSLPPRGALGFGVEITGIWIPGGEFFPSPSLLSLPPPPFFFPCARRGPAPPLPRRGPALPCPPLRGGTAPSPSTRGSAPRPGPPRRGGPSPPLPSPVRATRPRTSPARRRGGSPLPLRGGARPGSDVARPAPAPSLAAARPRRGPGAAPTRFGLGVVLCPGAAARPPARGVLASAQLA